MFVITDRSVMEREKKTQNKTHWNTAEGNKQFSDCMKWQQEIEATKAVTELRQTMSKKKLIWDWVMCSLVVWTTFVCFFWSLQFEFYFFSSCSFTLQMQLCVRRCAQSLNQILVCVLFWIRHSGIFLKKEKKKLIDKKNEKNSKSRDYIIFLCILPLFRNIEPILIL